MRALIGMGLGLLLACAHAREAEDASSARASAEPDGPAAEQPAAPASSSPDPAQAANAQPAGQGPSQKQGRVAGGKEDPDEIPVASSPSGLLKPGAERKVRDKLGVGAGEGSLREALQKFQKQHDLPATGALDQRTAEALGFDPDDLFERARGE